MSNMKIKIKTGKDKMMNDVIVEGKFAYHTDNSQVIEASNLRKVIDLLQLEFIDIETEFYGKENMK